MPSPRRPTITKPQKGKQSKFAGISKRRPNNSPRSDIIPTLSRFFDRPPRDWSIHEYLRYEHPSDLSRRQIIAHYTTDLKNIEDHALETLNRRARATELRRLYGAEVRTSFSPPSYLSDCSVDV